MQLASLFTSIQQVETRRKKDEETTKEYNCHKALANLTKTRYLKQMEKMSKQFKAETPLTNYPMPKSKNSTVLTNNISHKNDQILIPNIENNITDELNKLGISNSLTPTDNTNTNVEVEQLNVTQDNRLRKTVHETTSAHNGVKQKKITVTTNQSTPDVTSQNVKAKQKKITEENKATAIIKQKELTQDAASQNVEVKQKKIMEENKATATSNQKESTQDEEMDIEDTHVYAKSTQKKIREENKEMAMSNQKESTPDAASQNDPPVVKFHQEKITEEEKLTPHEEDKAMDIEDTPVMTHIYAKSPQNKRREENETSTAANQEMDDELPTNGKLTYQEHKTAYPWAHAASNNTFTRTDLAKEIEYVNHIYIEKFLTTSMKKLLTKTIKLPSHVNQAIEKKIKYLSEAAYRFRICSMIFKKKYNALRHARIELGYKENRCSFCNFMANGTSPIYKHYATNHGIPKEWIFSQELTNFVVYNCNNNTNSDPDSD